MAKNQEIGRSNLLLALELKKENQLRIIGAPPEQKKTLKKVLSKRLRVPMPEQESECALREELSRRYAELFDCLGLPWKGNESSWEDAFCRLAELAVPGLRQSQRGRMDLEDSSQAYVDRIYLLRVARNYAAKHGEKSMEKVAVRLTRHRQDLPKTFEKLGARAIRKAIAKAYDESCRWVVPNPREWHYQPSILGAWNLPTQDIAKPKSAPKRKTAKT